MLEFKIMRTIGTLFFLLRLLVSAAWADTPVNVPSNGIPNDYSTTVLGTVATKMLKAALVPPGGGLPLREYVYVENQSTNIVACSWTTVSPTVGGAGTFTLSAQYSWKSWGWPGFVPISELWCVSAAGSTTLTVQAF